MAKFRVNKDKNYTVMSNHHLRNKNLSFRAKGLLSMLLSLPDDWDYSIKGLCAISKENETAVKTTLKELKQFGYVRVTKLNSNQTKSKRFEYIYDIFEFPQDVDKPEKNSNSQRQFSSGGQANGGSGNSGQANYGKASLYKDIDKSNTNQQNTYQRNTYLSILKDAIEYNILINDHPMETGIIDEILMIMLEVVTSEKEYIKVAGCEKPKEAVKSIFMKLDRSHIEYVLMCLESTTTEIRNIKAYLTTALYNAPLTINNYYKQRVNHDLKGE